MDHKVLLGNMVNVERKVILVYKETLDYRVKMVKGEMMVLLVFRVLLEARENKEKLE
jgi:hypothetical protein